MSVVLLLQTFHNFAGPDVVADAAVTGWRHYQLHTYIHTCIHTYLLTHFLTYSHVHRPINQLTKYIA